MKQTVKRVGMILLAVMMLFSMTACGEVGKAEKAIENMFAAYKDLDFEKAKQFTEMGSLGLDESDDVVMSNDEFIKAMFEKLDYEIISSAKSDDSTVFVTTKITAIDIQPVFSNFFSEALNFFMSEENVDQELPEEEIEKKISELLVNSIKKDDLTTKSQTVIIKVTEMDGNWKVASDVSLADAITGGMITLTSQLQAATSAAAVE